MTDLLALTIRDVGELLARRSLSAVELLQATLERIDETEPLVHAYAHVNIEAAFEAAHRADREPRRGPLHGVPIAIKDVLETADSPTEAGSRLLAGFDEKELYEGAVTTMMRLVFLLYAEEHKLMPVDDPVYAANYAVSTLLEQLQDDEEKLGPDVLERRHAAWNRLLATFRAVHGGVEHDLARVHTVNVFDALEGDARSDRVLDLLRGGCARGRSRRRRGRRRSQ